MFKSYALQATPWEGSDFSIPLTIYDYSPTISFSVSRIGDMFAIFCKFFWFFFLFSKRFDPNDDFNLTAIENWVKYSDYFYYKGVITFNDMDDLHAKILNANFSSMHEKQVQHTVQNTFRTQANWQSIDRYFHGYDDDVIESATPFPAETLAKGIEGWNKMLTHLNLAGASEEALI